MKAFNFKVDDVFSSKLIYYFWLQVSQAILVTFIAYFVAAIIRREFKFCIDDNFSVALLVIFALHHLGHDCIVISLNS